MAVPKFDELTKPLLEVIKNGVSYTIKDVTTMLAQQLNLSSTDLTEMLPSGRQTVFKNRVGWAKTYLLKAGLIESPARATIRITGTGKKVVNDNPDKIEIPSIWSSSRHSLISHLQQVKRIVVAHHHQIHKRVL